ncbi:MAG: acyl carrier protein [Deltaproteobacteria bacterium]|nr:acyl carrier protein [Deltaproteobacteria bacterium]
MSKVKNLLRSVFGGSGNSAEQQSRADATASPVGEGEASAGRAPDEVLSELRSFVRDSLPDGVGGEEIDGGVNIFDAGYVNSISGAELLAYIESRYGVNIAESELIGRLDNLDALARHVASSSS